MRSLLGRSNAYSATNVSRKNVTTSFSPVRENPTNVHQNRCKKNANLSTDIAKNAKINTYQCLTQRCCILRLGWLNVYQYVFPSWMLRWNPAFIIWPRTILHIEKCRKENRVFRPTWRFHVVSTTEKYWLSTTGWREFLIKENND